MMSNKGQWRWEGDHSDEREKERGERELGETTCVGDEHSSQPCSSALWLSLFFSFSITPSITALSPHT